MSKITDYLESMGSTADEVAQFLVLEGVKGQRHNAQFCPIIKAIYKKFPTLPRGLKVVSFNAPAGYYNLGSYGSIWMEDRSGVRVTWNDSQTMDPRCPKAVADFVLNFDAHKYPHLVGSSRKATAEEAWSKLTYEEKMALSNSTYI